MLINNKEELTKRKSQSHFPEFKYISLLFRQKKWTKWQRKKASQKTERDFKPRVEKLIQ